MKYNVYYKAGYGSGKTNKYCVQMDGVDIEEIRARFARITRQLQGANSEYQAEISAITEEEKNEAKIKP